MPGTIACKPKGGVQARKAEQEGRDLGATEQQGAPGALGTNLKVWVGGVAVGELRKDRRDVEDLCARRAREVGRSNDVGRVSGPIRVGLPGLELFEKELVCAQGVLGGEQERGAHGHGRCRVVLERALKSLIRGVIEVAKLGDGFELCLEGEQARTLPASWQGRRSEVFGVSQTVENVRRALGGFARACQGGQRVTIGVDWINFR